MGPWTPTTVHIKILDSGTDFDHWLELTDVDLPALGRGSHPPTFDDEATDEVPPEPADRSTGVTLDAFGSVQPEEALSAFDGMDRLGTWELGLVAPGGVVTREG